MMELTADHSVFITIEDSIVDGGFGEKVARVLGPAGVRTKVLGLKKEFLDGFKAQDVLASNGITPVEIAQTAISLLKPENLPR